MPADTDLRGRLLLAAARAYIEARGLPADARPEHYARWLAANRAPDETEGVTVPIPLADVLAAAQEIERGKFDREQGARESAAVDSWITAWTDARAIMADPTRGDWKKRAALAVRALHLRGRQRDPDALLWRWRELTDGYADHAKPDKRAALERLGLELWPNSKDPAGAARKALQRAGARGLPRID